MKKLISLKSIIAFTLFTVLYVMNVNIDTKNASGDITLTQLTTCKADFGEYYPCGYVNLCYYDPFWDTCCSCSASGPVCYCYCD